MYSFTTGFSSPAEDFIEKSLDLNALLIRHKAATFFMRIKGSSMSKEGINNGDLIVVDRALTPKNNDFVVAVVNGALTLKRFIKNGNSKLLTSAKGNIDLGTHQEASIWGVVTYSISKHI